MMRLWQRLGALTRVNDIYSNPYDRLRAVGLSRMAWGLIVLSVLFLPSVLIVGQTLSLVQIANAAILGVLIVAMAIVLVLINQGLPDEASLVFIVSILIFTTFPYITNNNPANLVGFALPIVAAGTLLDRRSMIVVSMLVITTVVVTATMHIQGVLAPLYVSYTPLSPLNNLVTSILVLVACCLILYIFAGGYNAVRQRSMALANELHRSAEISEKLASSQSADDLLRLTAGLIRDQLGYYHVRIFLVEEQTGLLVYKAGTVVSGARERRIPMDDPSIFNEAIRTGRTVVVTTNDAPLRRSELLAAMRVQVIVPLRFETKSLGVLDVQGNRDTSAGDPNVQTLQILGSQIATALQNAKLFSDLQNSNHERYRLNEQLRSALHQVEEFNQEITLHTWAKFLAARGDLVIGYDWRQGITTTNTSLTAEMQTRFNNTLPEVYQDEEEQVLSVPIVSRGRALGAMEFRTPLDQPWSDRSVELAHVISQRLALALDNIRLYEQAQTIAAREHVVSQVASDLQSKTDLDTLVLVAAESFQAVLGATRTSVKLGLPPQTKIQNGGRSS